MQLPESGETIADMLEEIDRLRRERKAVILAHFYQEPDIQDLADVCGDSLALAQAAQKTDAEVIVFCGVNFMAETAKILNPEKTVVVPDIEAGCSLADTCPGAEFAKFVAAHPGHTVVSYINCSAEVKALSDWICTSSNAERVVAAIPPDEPILFAPDKNLGRYLAEKTGREMVRWQGVCIVHDIFRESELLKLKVRHPDAVVMAHPECQESVLAHADFIGSTTKIIEEGVRTSAPVVIIGTEPGVIHQMQRRAPDKLFIPLPGENECNCSECPYMRLNTVAKLRDCLRDLTPRIEVNPDLARRALRPIERMLSLG